MNKKQILATILSGLISLNTLTACSKNEKDEVVTEDYIDSTTYTVSILQAPYIYDKERRISYYIPLELKNAGFILVDNKLYKVESTTVKEYDRDVKNNIIRYTDNIKRETVGDKIVETEIQFLDEDEAKDYLIEHSYIESDEAILTKVK